MTLLAVCLDGPRGGIAVANRRVARLLYVEKKAVHGRWIQKGMRCIVYLFYAVRQWL